MENIRQSKYQGRFRRFGIITIIAIYLLILVGGIVRSTGSGMGCPDWPKCFGKWVPPTNVSQLPENYKEIYAQKRKVKNQVIAKYLARIGWQDLAKQITEDKSIYQELDFNVVKTWIEYVNRLLGVLIGFLVFLTLIFSFTYFKTDKIIVYTALSAFLLVGFQGWTGSIVVSTNLLPGMVTLHMLLAILIVFVLTYAICRAYALKMPFTQHTNSKFINVIFLLVILLAIVQVIFGTQVREAIDLIAKTLGEIERSKWISNLSLEFYIHRSFSWLVLMSQIYLYYLVRKRETNGLIISINQGILITVVLEIITGASIAYLGIPAFLQPIHLLLAIVILGLQFWTLLLMNATKIFPVQITELKQRVSI